MLKFFKKILHPQHELTASQRIGQSRQQLMQDFYVTFPGMILPQGASFYHFLIQHHLSCFIREDASSIIWFVSRGDATTQQVVICLPVSVELYHDFIQQFIQDLRQQTRPIVLYWAYSLPEQGKYVPYRIVLMHERAGQRQIIHYQIDQLHPRTSRFIPAPLQLFIYSLEIALHEYQFVAMQAVGGDALLIGDTIYWAALSLFLRLVHDAYEYHDDFIHWQAKQFTKLHFIDRGLQMVTFVYAPLFYIEQGVAVLNMFCFQSRLDHIGTSILDRQAHVFRAFRLGVLGYLLYMAWVKQEYLPLSQLPLVMVLQYILTCLTKKSDGLMRVVLFYLCNWSRLGIQVAFYLYMMSDTPLQHSITAPRYVFQWIAVMVKEGFKLTLHLSGMMLFLICSVRLFGQPIIQDPDHQVGLLAIALIVTQILIFWMEPYVFEYNNWVLTQQAEEHVLNLMHRLCQTPCHFTLHDTLARRVVQQAFSNQQMLTFSTSSPNIDTVCQLNITSHTALRCSDYQLSCTSRFFDRQIWPDQTALAHPPKVNATNMTWTFCAK